MFTRNCTLIKATMLPLLLCVACTLGSFLPWYEFRSTWNSPQTGFNRELQAQLVHKRLWLLSFGPYAFEKLPDSRYPDGCYVAAMCAGCTIIGIPLNRVHVSKLTAEQRVQIRWIRGVGLLLAVMNLVAGAGSFVELVCFVWQRYGGRLTIVVLGVLLGLLCFVLLQLLGAAIGDIFTSERKEQVPTVCLSVPVESPKCVGFPNRAYTLPNSTVIWEYGRILPLALVVEGFGLTFRGMLLGVRYRKKRSASPLA